MRFVASQAWRKSGSATTLMRQLWYLRRLSISSSMKKKDGPEEILDGGRGVARAKALDKLETARLDRLAVAAFDGGVQRLLEETNAIHLAWIDRRRVEQRGRAATTSHTKLTLFLLGE